MYPVVLAFGSIQYWNIIYVIMQKNNFKLMVLRSHITLSMALPREGGKLFPAL